jgi:hypothetical protein
MALYTPRTAFQIAGGSKQTLTIEAESPEIASFSPRIARDADMKPQ